MTAVATQVGALAGRSLAHMARQPARVIPPLLFPTALMLINASGLAPSTELPGFPTTSFLAFVLAVPFIQGALFATLNAGADLARDIQTGFLNRLSLTAMRDVALVTGHLSGVVVFGVVQAAFYVAVGLTAGVRFESGPAGIVVILLYGALISLAFGALGAYLALATGSGEAVQGAFPLFFVFLFVSSMLTPRDLMENEWFRLAATVNPVSYLLEGIRSLIITGWDVQALTLGIGLALVMTVVSLVLAGRALRKRMTRT
jgi:ABC-2 type transport system permease protein